MLKRSLFTLCACALMALVACQSSDRIITATPEPTNTALPATNTPIPTATLNPLNPHEGLPEYTSLVTNADLVGAPNVTSFPFGGTDIIVNYPSGFNPLCEAFNNVGTAYPCAYVFDPDETSGAYPFEINSKAGYFGFTFDPVIVLRPSDNYRYLIRCDIRQGTPYFTSSIFGIQTRFLSDEFPNGMYTFTRQDTGIDSHIWVFEVTEMLVVTFQCGIDIDWASYPELNFTFSYMDIQVVEPNYGGNDYVELP